MDLVAELSEEIAAEYREKQKTKLQRTFVKASDAASSKVKGIKKNCELYFAHLFIFFIFCYTNHILYLFIYNLGKYLFFKIICILTIIYNLHNFFT